MVTQGGGALWLSRGLLQLDDMVGAHTDYNEEEEEQKYFRRKRLGVVKNVLAASLAAMLTYSVYLGTALAPKQGTP